MPQNPGRSRVSALLAALEPLVLLFDGGLTAKLKMFLAVMAVPPQVAGDGLLLPHCCPSQSGCQPIVLASDSRVQTAWWGQQLGVSGTDTTTARTLSLAILQQRVQHAFFHMMASLMVRCVKPTLKERPSMCQVFRLSVSV